MNIKLLLKRGKTVKLTKNLYRHEVRCRCDRCDNETIDYMIVKLFQEICDEAARRRGVEKVVANILSGFRCDYWNGKQGGKPESLHTKGMALDFNIVGMSAGEVEDIINDVMNPDEYDYYLINDTNVHIEYDC